MELIALSFGCVLILTSLILEWFFRVQARKRSMNSKDAILDEIAQLVSDALGTDGAHHKQWYLERMADLLNLAHDSEGIAP